MISAASRLADIYRGLAETLAGQFVYVRDQEQYGRAEHWAELRVGRGGKLYGDCEDFCITLARRSIEAGIPKAQLCLHAVIVGQRPDHLVISCANTLVADCNVEPQPVIWGHYYQWHACRRLNQRDWRRDPNAQYQPKEKPRA